MRIGLLVMWCLVLPLGYVMAFVFDWGVVGLKFGGTVGLLIGAIVIYMRWQSRVSAYTQRTSVAVTGKSSTGC